ncbi:MAG: ribosomal-processing cysteine protease Prp [Fastidiosipilaceae bacterium]|jgi:uncharacterized protein YsxB (DUF464 family)|nr:ribosomal-processing cysteine protease Prp [Clostridiaceae bacterium]
MITVRVKRNPDGFPYALSSTGHAGYAEPGQDIMCAAVSALATTTLSALTDLIKVEVDYVLAEGEIYCEVLEQALTDKQREGIQLLFDTFELGCIQLADSYDYKYIKVVKAR